MMTTPTREPLDRFDLVEAVEMIEREVPTIDAWIIGRRRTLGGSVSVSLIDTGAG